MNIICKKDSLLTAINMVSKAAANRSTLPILECLLLEANEGVIRLTGNDLQIGIQYEGIAGEIIEEGCIALGVKIFSDIVRRLPEDQVVIKTSANQVTVIQSGKSEFKILGLPADEFPQFPAVPESEKVFEIPASIFREMIKKIIFSIAIDDVKPAFNGALFEVSHGKMNLVSSDTFRISYVTYDIQDQDAGLNLIVPGKALNEFYKILPDEEETMVDIYATKQHILFNFDSCMLVSRLINADFIQYRHSFDVAPTTTIKVQREYLYMCLERASLISTKEDKKYPIKLTIGSDDRLIVTSNTESGASYEEISVTMEGEAMEIAFNPRYLIDAIKVIGGNEVSLYFTTPISPVIIKSDEDDSCRYLILPLRLKS